MPLFIAIALSLLAGAAVPLQAGSNARLGVVLGHPFWATVISLLISGLAIALVMLIVKVPRPNLAALLTGPWWIWLGGLTGVFYITADRLLRLAGFAKKHPQPAKTARGQRGAGRFCHRFTRLKAHSLA